MAPRRCRDGAGERRRGRAQRAIRAAGRAAFVRVCVLLQPRRGPGPWLRGAGRLRGPPTAARPPRRSAAAAASAVAEAGMVAKDAEAALEVEEAAVAETQQTLVLLRSAQGALEEGSTECYEQQALR